MSNAARSASASDSPPWWRGCWSAPLSPTRGGRAPPPPPTWTRCCCILRSGGHVIDALRVVGRRPPATRRDLVGVGVGDPRRARDARRRRGPSRCAPRSPPPSSGSPPPTTPSGALRGRRPTTPVPTRQRGARPPPSSSRREASRPADIPPIPPRPACTPRWCVRRHPRRRGRSGAFRCARRRLHQQGLEVVKQLGGWGRVASDMPAHTSTHAAQRARQVAAPRPSRPATKPD